MRGSIGTSLVEERTSSKNSPMSNISKQRKYNKIFKNIQYLYDNNHTFLSIARELEMNILDVVNVYNDYTHRYMSKISKVYIEDLLSNGLTVVQIADFFECSPVKVILIRNEIKSVTAKIVKEVNLAIKIDDYINKNENLKSVSSLLDINVYALFYVYNKYYKVYSSDNPSIDTVLELLKLKLTLKDISRFYNISINDVMSIIGKYNEKVHMENNYKVSSEDTLSTAYYSSTNNDFHASKWISK